MSEVSTLVPWQSVLNQLNSWHLMPMPKEFDCWIHFQNGPTNDTVSVVVTIVPSMVRLAGVLLLKGFPLLGYLELFVGNWQLGRSSQESPDGWNCIWWLHWNNDWGLACTLQWLLESPDNLIDKMIPHTFCIKVPKGGNTSSFQNHWLQCHYAFICPPLLMICSNNEIMRYFMCKWCWSPSMIFQYFHEFLCS